MQANSMMAFFVDFFFLYFPILAARSHLSSASRGQFGCGCK